MGNLEVEIEFVKIQLNIMELLRELDENEKLKNSLSQNQLFLLKKFLLKEYACLKGILKENSEKDEGKN